MHAGTRADMDAAAQPPGSAQHAGPAGRGLVPPLAIPRVRHGARGGDEPPGFTDIIPAPNHLSPVAAPRHSNSNRGHTAQSAYVSAAEAPQPRSGVHQTHPPTRSPRVTPRAAPPRSPGAPLSTGRTSCPTSPHPASPPPSAAAAQKIQQSRAALKDKLHTHVAWSKALSMVEPVRPQYSEAAPCELLDGNVATSSALDLRDAAASAAVAAGASVADARALSLAAHPDDATVATVAAAPHAVLHRSMRPASRRAAAAAAAKRAVPAGPASNPRDDEDEFEDARTNPRGVADNGNGPSESGSARGGGRGESRSSGGGGVTGASRASQAALLGGAPRQSSAAGASSRESALHGFTSGGSSTSVGMSPWPSPRGTAPLTEHASEGSEGYMPLRERYGALHTPDQPKRPLRGGGGDEAEDAGSAVKSRGRRAFAAAVAPATAAAAAFRRAFDRGNTTPPTLERATPRQAESAAASTANAQDAPMPAHDAPVAAAAMPQPSPRVASTLKERMQQRLRGKRGSVDAASAAAPANGKTASHRASLDLSSAAAGAPAGTQAATPRKRSWLSSLTLSRRAGGATPRECGAAGAPPQETLAQRLQVCSNQSLLQAAQDLWVMMMFCVWRLAQMAATYEDMCVNLWRLFVPALRLLCALQSYVMQSVLDTSSQSVTLSRADLLTCVAAAAGAHAFHSSALSSGSRTRNHTFTRLYP